MRDSGDGLPQLAERERVRLGAGLVEADLERSLADPVVLARELVQAAVAEHAGSVLVDVAARGQGRSLAIEE
jgi:hypothetical protein